MKIYASEAVNGSAPTDPGEPDEVEDEEIEYDYSALFNAPNYADFIKTAPNSQSRVYERKVQSMMKAGMVMSLNNEQWADAATFLKHGPGFAKAAGNLAAEDARAAAIIDMMTAPDSPYVIFAMIAYPFIGQLFRNHQPEMTQAGQTWRERRAQRKQEKLAGVRENAASPIRIRVFKREFKLPIRFRIKLPKLRNIVTAFFAPTQHPGQITQEVLTDPSVIKALHKLGIFPRRTDEAA